MSNGAGRRVTSAGFAVMLLAVSAAVGSGDIGFLLIGLAGVLVGANLVFLGVQIGGDGRTTPAFAAFLRRNLGLVGLIMASSSVTALAGEAEPGIACAMLALLLLGLCFINIRVRGE